MPMLFMIDLPELMPLQTALLRHGMIAMKTPVFPWTPPI